MNFKGEYYLDGTAEDTRWFDSRHIGLAVEHVTTDPTWDLEELDDWEVYYLDNRPYQTRAGAPPPTPPYIFEVALILGSFPDGTPVEILISADPPSGRPPADPPPLTAEEASANMFEAVQSARV